MQYKLLTINIEVGYTTCLFLQVASPTTTTTEFIITIKSELMNCKHPIAIFMNYIY